MRQLFVGLVIVTAGLAFAADEKKAEKPVGTWVKDADGIEMKFQFLPKDVLKITVMFGENGVIVTTKITQDKDKVIRAEVTESEEKGMFHAKPTKGTKLSFKFAADGTKATVSNFEGHNVEEGAKQVVEGEYKKVEEKEKADEKNEKKTDK